MELNMVGESSNKDQTKVILSQLKTTFFSCFGTSLYLVD